MSYVAYKVIKKRETNNRNDQNVFFKILMTTCQVNSIAVSYNFDWDAIMESYLGPFSLCLSLSLFNSLPYHTRLNSLCPFTGAPGRNLDVFYFSKKKKCVHRDVRCSELSRHTTHSLLDVALITRITP